MKKLIIAILSIIIVTGCDHGEDGVSDPNLVRISMISHVDPELFKKTVVLYEDDEYLITTYFDQYISSYPFDVLNGYEAMKEKASQDILSHDIILIQDYAKYPSDETYILAYHLENGSCLIYDKQSQQIVTTIQMEKYSIGGPMSTTAGRKFYIKPGVVFLLTIDQMS